MSQQNINITPKQFAEFVQGTHPDNLVLILDDLADGKWHWMLPEEWNDNEQTRSLLKQGLFAVVLRQIACRG